MAHSNIAHTVLVLSGKGGVGKSTISVQLALSLVAQGLKVGLLDVDLCGPSIPRMLGIEASVVHQSDAGWIPVQAAENLHVMSLAFLLTNREDAVVWRGPKKTSMIEQFISNVCWGQLDYLVVDTPPGTSDEHLTVVEKMALLNVDGAVLVTTPQEIAVADVRKEASFCKKTNLRILGIVENMSGFVCPHCSDCTNIFAAGGGEGLAAQLSVPFLGRVPIEPRLTSALEEGSNFQTIFATSATAAACHHICDVVITSTGGNPAAPVPALVAAAGVAGAATAAAAPAAGDGLP